jgi:hypothetical protein
MPLPLVNLKVWQTGFQIMTNFQESSIGHATGFHIYCFLANSKEAMFTGYLTRKGSIR